MFEYISTIVDILIAAIGLFFVIRQAREDRLTKNKQEEEKRICLELASEAVKIEGLLTKMKDARKLVEDYRRGYTSDYYEAVKKVTVDYKEIYESVPLIQKEIYEIYKNLIRHESMFSLSIGFDRIINACRDVIYNMNIVNNYYYDGYINPEVHDLLKKIGYDQSGVVTEDDKQKLKNVLIRVIEEMDEKLKLLENAYPLIMELKIKFEEE